MRAVLAERGLDRDILLDSAGTSDWEAGSAPDPRSVSIAARHGIDISGQRARKLTPDDFSRFDLILGMDRSNVRDLKALVPADMRDRVHLFLELAQGRTRDVPDPYYEGQDAFAAVYRMIREASEALATRLEAAAPKSGQASSTM